MSAATFVVVVFLAAGNSWAVASFAKKYGMVCKSCHSFGSELNSLGLKFKKNGHSFGEESAPQKVKTQQVEPRKEKAAESSAKSTDKSESPTQEGKVDSPADSEPPEPEQEVPETIVYSCLSSDGTPHYSDNPCVNPQVEAHADPENVTKKSSRAGLRPLSAKASEKLQGDITKTAARGVDTTVLTKGALPTHPGAPPGDSIPVYQPKSYEDCMEMFFVTSPVPQSPDAAMEQFREAKSSCVRFEKIPKR